MCDLDRFSKSQSHMFYVILCIFLVVGKYATSNAGITSDVATTTSDNEMLMQS